MSADACASSAPSLLGLAGFVGVVLAIVALCFAPVWIPALIEYCSPLARAERARTREINRRAAELVAIGVGVDEAKRHASKELIREATEILSAQAAL